MSVARSIYRHQTSEDGTTISTDPQVGIGSATGFGRDQGRCDGLALRRWVFGGLVTVPSGNGGKESISIGGALALMNYRRAIGRRPWASFLNSSKKDQCPDSHQSEMRNSYLP
jgi:hypothetical protein